MIGARVTGSASGGHAVARATLAREQPARYLTAVPAQDRPTLPDAVASLEGALAQLSAVDLTAETDHELLEQAVELQRAANRLAAQQLRVLADVDARDAYGAQGAVTAASWYRAATRLDHGQAARLVNAARRLSDLPLLGAALTDGSVTLAHATAITDAAVPTRMPAVSAAEETLVELARSGSPRQVKIALRHLADIVDDDGSDAAPLPGDGPDARRHVDAWVGLDGLVELRGTLAQIDGEALLTALDALETRDAPDTPPQRRRSPGQRRADALGALARWYLDSGQAPEVQGNKPHLLVMVDLATLAGDPQAATRRPRMRFTGEISPAVAAEIARQAKVTAVQTMGPWRVVNVGRTMRTLPGWLRTVLEAVHGHCRGPHCDRPVVWTQAHHQHAWSQGGDTDVNATIPLCHAHHDLVSNGGWKLRFDPDTGVCTWTSPANITILTHPPPP